MLFARKIKISTEYSDFLNIFLEKKTLVLSKLTKFNQHAIKLQNGKQLLHGLIYNLESVERKTVKIYIKTNLANGFI